MNNIFIFIIYILFINIFSFFLMGIDKKKAIQYKIRISEKTFFMLALLLGATGVYAGMQKYRHKTKHIKFTLFIPILILLNIFIIFNIFIFLINLNT